MGNRIFFLGKTTTTDYLSGYQYKNGQLQFYTMAEGYVKIEEGKPVYVYNYTDHLGNVRLSYTDNNGIAQVLQEKNYYPFGLLHKGYNETNLQPYYHYGYNGKELQDENNLNWYDYGARNYSPELGRWFAVDPLAEETQHISPYGYALNNPVYFIDPDGMTVDDWYLGSDFQIHYNEEVTGQEDLNKLGIEGTYIGESFDVVNEDGSHSYYAKDGSYTRKGMLDFSLSFTSLDKGTTINTSPRNYGFRTQPSVTGPGGTTGHSAELTASYTLSSSPQGNRELSIGLDQKSGQAVYSNLSFYNQKGERSQIGIQLTNPLANYYRFDYDVIGNNPIASAKINLSTTTKTIKIEEAILSHSFAGYVGGNRKVKTLQVNLPFYDKLIK